MKTCFKCGEKKDRSEFYAHSAMADGLLGKCKACTRSDVTKNREANIETVRAYDRARGVRANQSAVTAEYRAQHPDRVAANNAVARAVRSGRLTARPCAVCGSQKSVAHHPDYAPENYLRVVWLCQVHHKQEHARIDAEQTCATR